MKQQLKPSSSSPSVISSEKVRLVEKHLGKVIQSCLPITFPTKKIALSSFEHEGDTDQWHFSLKVDLPVPEECRTIKSGKLFDKKHRAILDLIRKTRVELLVALKQEIGHMYFLQEEFHLLTPKPPEGIALYHNDQGKWKLLNQAERILYTHQYPGKKAMMDYSEMAVEQNWFHFNEKDKENPFQPLVYSHLEVTFSFILANVTFGYYVKNTKQKNRTSINPQRI